MNVFWLASWFPNRTNITNGDFIERQAKAVAPYLDSLYIIAVIKDEALPFNAVEITEQQQGNITTYIVYYGRSNWRGNIEQILSVRKYISIHKKIIAKIINEKGKPDLLHVNVAMKAGLVAKKIKQQYGIPYIVTEHWTAYYRHAKPNVFEMGNYFTRLTKSILKNASLLITVSDELGKAINHNLLSVPYKVIPNVVDTTIFYPEEKTDKAMLEMVHVSSMEYQKNVEDIIRALALWKQRGGNFMMQFYGPVKEHLQHLVIAEGLDGSVFFKGEVLQNKLAPVVRKSDLLILYSRYETFGCVLIEANAAGVPVLVSDLAVFHEFIKANLNGVFVSKDNPEALATALEFFANSKNDFDKKQIATDTRERFGYENVGQQIKDVYVEILKKPL